MNRCEKVFENVHILKLIFKYLDFEDQLRFAQVNEKWRNAYEVCCCSSGNVNYTSLHIFRHDIPRDSNKIIIAGDMGVYGTCLKNIPALSDFLVLYVDRVRDLVLIRVDESLCLKILRRTHSNLRSFSTYGMNFTRAIAENLADNLEELTIIDSFAGAYTILDKIMRRLTNLQKLQIIDGEGGGGGHCGRKVCSNFVKFHFPKLEILKLNVNLHTANVSLPAAGILKQLEIRLQNEQRFKRQPLQYLKVLHLSLDRYTDQLFPILTESCKNLESLTLENFYFGRITTISLPAKVRELSFLGCSGLSYSCYKRILTEFQIIKFCSRYSNIFVDYEFQDFKISSHIQSMEIDFVKITKFRLAYENNSQLKELICQAMNLTGCEVSFHSTPNLQRLEIPFMPKIGSLTQLTSLQILRLTLSGGVPEWSAIEDLLKHPTLHEISIMYIIIPGINDLHPIVDVAGQPSVSSFHTNITKLTIEPYIFKTWMKCWLELFATNPQMTLVCWPLPKAEVLSFAKELIEHKNFPSNLKAMDVCCFTIDCKELRWNFEAVKSKYFSCTMDLNQLTQKGGHEDGKMPRLKMARRNRIVLSWKYEYNF